MSTIGKRKRGLLTNHQSNFALYSRDLRDSSLLADDRLHECVATFIFYLKAAVSSVRSFWKRKGGIPANVNFRPNLLSSPMLSVSSPTFSIKL